MYLYIDICIIIIKIYIVAILICYFWCWFFLSFLLLLSFFHWEYKFRCKWPAYTIVYVFVCTNGESKMHCRTIAYNAHLHRLLAYPRCWACNLHTHLLFCRCAVAVAHLNCLLGGTFKIHYNYIIKLLFAFSLVDALHCVALHLVVVFCFVLSLFVVHYSFICLCSFLNCNCFGFSYKRASIQAIVRQSNIQCADR